MLERMRFIHQMVFFSSPFGCIGASIFPIDRRRSRCFSVFHSKIGCHHRRFRCAISDAKSSAIKKKRAGGGGASIVNGYLGELFKRFGAPYHSVTHNNFYYESMDFNELACAGNRRRGRGRDERDVRDVRP